jgi:valyl-tRNA synthetase
MSKSLGNVIDPLAITDGRSFEELIEEVSNGNLSEKEQKVAKQSIQAEFHKGIELHGRLQLNQALI